MDICKTFCSEGFDLKIGKIVVLVSTLTGIMVILVVNAKIWQQSGFFIYLFIFGICFIYIGRKLFIGTHVCRLLTVYRHTCMYIGRRTFIGTHVCILASDCLSAHIHMCRKHECSHAYICVPTKTSAHTHTDVCR
jgi:hypothetical protein